MSNGNSAEATNLRTFKTVNGKVTSGAGAETTQGALTFVRPSQLAKDGITGVVAEGIYEAAVPSRFDASKNDYKIRAENGDLIIVNSAGSLSSQMSRVELGSYVRITYKGKKALTSGKMQGKLSHSFVVEIAD